MRRIRKTLQVPLGLLIILICFPQLSETIYTPALPALSDFFSSSPAWAQWTLTVYFIGFACGVGFWGHYSERWGRRKAILQGLVIYILSCVGCAFSNHFVLFLFFRIIQGFGISIGSVVVQSIFREVYRAEKRHEIFSVLNLVIAMSPAVGPLLGGYLTEWFHWQSTFWLLIALGCVLGSALYLRLPETNKSVGTPVNLARILFVFQQMAKNPRVIAFAALVGLFNGVMFSYYSQAPFIFIDLLGLSPGHYGMLGLAPALGVVAGSLVSKAKGARYGAMSLIGAGAWGALGSMCILNATMFLGTIYTFPMVGMVIAIVIPMLLFFFSFSLAMPSLLGMALVGYEHSIGIASSLFGLAYYNLTAVFNFLMGYLDNGTIVPMPLYFLALSIMMVVVFLLYKNKQSLTTGG